MSTRLRSRRNHPMPWIGGEIDIDTGLGLRLRERIYGGGGTYERSLGTFYHKAYHSQMAMFPDNNYNLPENDDAGTVHWKEFTGFFEPYDVRGYCVHHPALYRPAPDR